MITPKDGRGLLYHHHHHLQQRNGGVTRPRIPITSSYVFQERVDILSSQLILHLLKCPNVIPLAMHETNCAE